MAEAKEELSGGMREEEQIRGWIKEKESGASHSNPTREASPKNHQRRRV